MVELMDKDDFSLGRCCLSCCRGCLRISTVDPGQRCPVRDCLHLMIEAHIVFSEKKWGHAAACYLLVSSSVSLLMDKYVYIYN